jgi:uncharacterized membrane protein YsdA (DUF1294 family)/cold shock CspA family protein
MRDKGKLVTWNDEKGYGFIAPFSGAAQVFIHARAFGNRTRRPELDDVVTYTLSKDKQGRPRAMNATLAGANRPPRTERRSSAWDILIAAIFLSAVGAAVFVVNLPPAIFVIYLAAGVVTFIAYAIDKSAARKGRWRTKEGTLHLLSLLGGWPGALVAQSVLRHKSRKQPFRMIFWLTVILNCAALAWLSTPGGRAVIG